MFVIGNDEQQHQDYNVFYIRVHNKFPGGLGQHSTPLLLLCTKQ
jgi:hypothetical protein